MEGIKRLKRSSLDRFPRNRRKVEANDSGSSSSSEEESDSSDDSSSKEGLDTCNEGTSMRAVYNRNSAANTNRAVREYWSRGVRLLVVVPSSNMDQEGVAEAFQFPMSTRDREGRSYGSGCYDFVCSRGGKLEDYLLKCIEEVIADNVIFPDLEPVLFDGSHFVQDSEVGAPEKEVEHIDENLLFGYMIKEEIVESLVKTKVFDSKEDVDSNVNMELEFTTARTMQELTCCIGGGITTEGAAGLKRNVQNFIRDNVTFLMFPQGDNKCNIEESAGSHVLSPRQLAIVVLLLL